MVNKISEDAILGMPSAEAHDCGSDFGKATLKLQGQELACNDRYGRLLRTKIQVIRSQTVPPGTEQLTVAKVATRNYCPMGLVEGQLESVPTAACLITRDQKGQVSIRCMNSPRATPQTGSGSSSQIIHRGGGDRSDVKDLMLEGTPRVLDQVLGRGKREV